VLIQVSIQAVIIVRVIFICSFLFCCLLFNHSFPTNPNKITNCFINLFSSVYLQTTFAQCVSSIFDFLNTVKSQIQRRMPRGGLTYSPSGKAALRATDGGHTTRPIGSDERPQQSVELDQFTKVDRRQVVEELMMHDEVLAYLYDALFPSMESSNMAMNGGGEESGGDGNGGYEDEGKQQQQQQQQRSGASGWRSRVSDETTNSDVVRMPQMRASDSTRSNMGSQIKLDPTVHEYLRQMSAGRDGL
jgi:hypothetical protein